jgi:tetratricopeptide (TPR) repeat protein
MSDSLDVLAARGDVMVATGDAREGLRLYHLADVRGCIPCFYPQYARAYDQLNRRDSAVVWYEKYVSAQSPDLGGVDGRELAKAYRRLGELYEERSEWKKAIERYQDFVTLWSKADPALQPSVRDVKARIERLRARAG